MSAAPRPTLVDSRRQFFWGEHELIDHGVPARIGPSAWTVYTCLLRHVNAQAVTFPSVSLLMGETGMSNKTISTSIGTLQTVGLIEVDRDSHQWNVYRVLDALRAIKKNGWEAIREEAGVKTTRARSRTKQVKNLHEAGVKTTPEQVKNLHTKKNHLKRNKERGVQELEGDAREASQLHALVVEAPQPEHSSKDQAAPEPQTHEAGPLTPGAEVALELAADVPASTALVAPDGVAADAADSALDSQAELDLLFGRQDDTTTNTEQVLAAAGGAAAGAAEGSPAAKTEAGSLGLDVVRPVDPQILAARPVAPLEGKAHRALKVLVGKGLPEMLKETTRTGGLSRALWLRLEPAEIDLVRVMAQAEAKVSGANMITLAVLGLDRLIGAVKAPKAEKAKPATQTTGPTGPVDLSHLDPQLVVGQRCTAWGDLGVVDSVGNASYIVRRDDGELITVDRHLAKHLQRLRASDAPAPTSKAEPDTSSLPVPVGTSWRPKAGGDPVVIKAADGINRTLSNGATLPFYLVQTKFEPVSV